MDNKQIMSLSALELGQAIKDKRTTSVEATSAMLEAISAKDSIYNCYINVFSNGDIAVD